MTQIEVFQVVLFCALHLFVGHYKHFEYGCKSVFYNPHIYCYESLHLENHFVDVSTILLHKMYYNISQVYLESLKTQKNQTFSRGFLINFVLFL